MSQLQTLRGITLAWLGLALAATPALAQSTPNWHGGARLYRVDFQASANGFARTDKVAPATPSNETELTLLAV